MNNMSIIYQIKLSSDAILPFFQLLADGSLRTPEPDAHPQLATRDPTAKSQVAGRSNPCSANDLIVRMFDPVNVTLRKWTAENDIACDPKRAGTR